MFETVLDAAVPQQECQRKERESGNNRLNNSRFPAADPIQWEAVGLMGRSEHNKSSTVSGENYLCI